MRASDLVRAVSFVALPLLAATACDSVGVRSVRALPPTSVSSVAPGTLRSPADFAAIADPAERSRALFVEATRVMFHPRCINCHPSDDVPKQGDLSTAHDPPVIRGPEDQGAPGMECSSCHQDHNLELARVPGAPKWHLAPKEMAWVGRTPATLCAQLKNPATNGGKTLAQIVDHTAHDPLVAWGWAPGHDRAPAPGTQAQFGALMQAWMDAGAVCPQEGAK